MTNAAVYYFSATGNSLIVARDLAKELGVTQVIPVTKALHDDKEQPFEKIGIVYPVYMFGLPLIVAEFLRKVRLKPGAYIFAAATLGGLPGRAHSMTRAILKERGLELAAGFSVLMPGNYTPLYAAIPEKEQEEMFIKERERVKEIAGYVSAGRRGAMEEKPFLPNFLLYKLLYKGGSSRIPASGKYFWITDACTRCGLCANVCPAENIKLPDGKPVWLDHCQHCMACLQWCPVEAIQYKKSTLGRKRYHHPSARAQDIMEQR